MIGEMGNMKNRFKTIGALALAMAAVLCLLVPGKAYSDPPPDPIDPIFRDMGTASYSDVRNEAIQELGDYPKYKSMPASLPAYDYFCGYFIPDSNDTQVAIFSDDGVHLYVDGTCILSNMNVGQALPWLDNPPHPSLIPLDLTWVKGKAYFIRVLYSNVSYLGSLDIDGCTLFAYNGGGSAYECFVDIDTDSNNDGSINDSDEPIEEDSPGKYVELNADDDNSNGIPDINEMGPVTGENDLVPVNLAYHPYWYYIYGYQIVLNTIMDGTGQKIRVWTTPTKGTQIHLPSTYYVGPSNPPPVVYVEGKALGERTLYAKITRPDHTEIMRDEVKFTIRDTTPPAPGTASSPQYTSSTPITVSYSGASDYGSGLDRVELWYKKGQTGSWTYSGNYVIHAGSGPFSFTPSGGDTYYFDLVAQDNAGNRSATPSGNGDTSTIYDDAPPTITITTPPAAELHKASNQTTVRLAGTASDAGTGVASVEVAVLSGFNASKPTHPWNTATYTSGAQTWTWDWTNVQTGNYTIWASATDVLGHISEISRNVTVTNVSVIYVSKDGNNTTGASWATAKTTIAGGIDAASSGMDVWVAQGTYTECITHKSGVGLYGGFAGTSTETAREHRNWAANKAIIDGNWVGRVVTIPSGATSSTIVDGFTIQRGGPTYDAGAGIYCYNASATIANNIICGNRSFNNRGGGLFAWLSSLVVVGNVFTGNEANSGGGGICFLSTSGQIANNTIINNVSRSDYPGYDGGGIYLDSSSPTLSNNIVAKNSYGGIYKSGGSPTFQKNDVFGNNGYEYSWTPNYPVGTDLVPTDPVITNIDWDDWHIAGASPCKDQGVYISLDSDMDAESRVYGSGVDIGADEWHGTDPGIIYPIVQHLTRWQTDSVYTSCPLVADLIPGGDNEVAVIAQDGRVHIWRSDGTSAWTSTGYYTLCYEDDECDTTLSAADIDQPENPGNQHLELIAPSGDDSDYPWTGIYAFGYDANASTFKPLAGWPVMADYYFDCVAAAIGDANLDGTREVVAGDECCILNSWNPAGGSYLWQQVTGNANTAIRNSSVALGDVNYFDDPDRIPDAVVGSYWSNPLFSFPGDCWGWLIYSPVYTSGSTWPKSAGAHIQSSPAIGLIDEDSENDIAVGCDDGRLYMWLSYTQTWTSYQLASSTDPNKAIRSDPVITELDNQQCVVVGCNNGRVYAIKSDGDPITGWPSDGIDLSYKITTSPVIADVMNTGAPQIVVARADGRVYALWSDGNNHSGGPIAAAWRCGDCSFAQINATPTVGSLNGTTVSMFIGSSDGIYKTNLYTLQQGQFEPNSERWPWPTFHRDNARTGCQTTDDNPAPPISVSIAGKVTLSGNPVQQAKIYIRLLPGVTLPGVYGQSGTRSDPLLSAGSGAIGNEVDEGQYCISQLPPDETYRIIATDASGNHSVTIDNIEVETGRVVINIQLTP